MKKSFIITCLAVAVVVGSAVFLTAREPLNSKEGPTPGEFRKVNGVPVATMLNINRIAAWYEANGEQERLPGSGNAGTYYPRGTSTAIYSSGLVWGGQFKDGKTPEIRANGQSYRNGTKPGAILSLRTSQVEDPNADDVRIWRIRRDYSTANLQQDAAEINQVGLLAVTSGQVQSVRDQYGKDWKEWPAAKGAPFYDADGDGKYTPKFTGQTVNGVSVPVLYPEADEPGLAGADQVIWYVCNDIGVNQPWSCPESGMEEQTTIWGYGRTDPIGNVIFKRFRLMYKGTKDTPLDGKIENMYLCQWSDPDIGDNTDDFAGSDTVLSMNYAYNGVPSDSKYQAFGLVPPAAGFDFLQGPLVQGVTGQDVNRNGVDDGNDFGIWNLRRRGPGVINLPMTSAMYFAAGGRYTDPPFTLGGSIQWWQMLRGLPPTQQGPPDPAPVVNPTTGQPTVFWLSGDPTTNPKTGWCDGTLDNPGDRRLLLTSGPFTMALGDTQELVSALVCGLGNSNINSISIMKFNDRFVQLAYDSLFSLPKPPENPKVVAFVQDNNILLDWGTDSAAIAKTESVIVIGNYQFEGYKVYQFPDATGDPAKAILLAQYDKINGIKTISQPTLDPNSGELITLPVQYGKDTGLKYQLFLSTDAVTGRPFVTGQRYYFAVTAYNYTPTPENPFKTYESVASVNTIIPESARPGTSYPYTFNQQVPPTARGGDNDGSGDMKVINSTIQKGWTYVVTFDTAGGKPVWTLTNTTLGKTLYSGLTYLATVLADTTKYYPDREGGVQFTVVAPRVGLLLSMTNQSGQNVYEGRTWDYAAATTGAYSYNQDPNFGILANGSATSPSDGIDTLLGGKGNTNRDYEIRFDGTGSYAIMSFGLQRKTLQVPFSVWDVGRGSGDTPRQVIAGYKDSSQTSKWNVTPTGMVVGGKIRQVFEPIWITDYTYPGDSAGVAANALKVTQVMADQANPANAVNAAFIWVKNRDSIPPPTGTIYKFRKSHEIRSGDTYTWATSAVVNGNTELAKEQVTAIKAFPNPYYGSNRSETSRDVKYITFNHLPPGKSILRIFDLSGIQVQKLEKDDPGQFLTWNLQNANGLPVASGIYIVYIDMPDLGVTKTLKVAIIQEQQILSRY